jgi:diketogulonate reductase-like aldo/keto reductase
MKQNMSQSINKHSTYKLNNGTTIPISGFGVYKTDKGEAAKIVYEALKVGFRHFDTAKLYGNEKETAEGIAKFLEDHPEVKRSEVYYTTKIWNNDQGYEKSKLAIAKSLEDAKSIGYIDLFLIHSPISSKAERLGTWKALEEAIESGKVKTIGVSNYGIHHLKELLEFPELKIKPAVDQLELQPWLPHVDIQKFAKENDILLEAYAPLTRGKKFDDPELQAIAKKHGKTPAEILLRWSYDQGFVVLSKTATISRIPSNFNVLDHVELDEEDHRILHKPESHERSTAWDPTTYFDEK